MSISDGAHVCVFVHVGVSFDSKSKSESLLWPIFLEVNHLHESFSSLMLLVGPLNEASFSLPSFPFFCL